MRVSNVAGGAAGGVTPAPAVALDDPVRRFFEVLPRPLRFLGVGGLGLLTDLAVFTARPRPRAATRSLARLVSLAIATVVTWRLNRALTFDRSGRRPADEAMRYAAVAAAAQAVSYAVVRGARRHGVRRAVPQLAVIVGAAAGALVSYSGQAPFAFRPRPAPDAAP